MQDGNEQNNDEDICEDREEDREDQNSETENHPDLEKETEEYLDAWLSDLDEARTLVITRIEPKTARGRLEEIPVDRDGPPIDLEEIRNRWGGRKLSLRIRRKDGTLGKARYIELYSFEPLVYGKPIETRTPNPWKNESSSSENEQKQSVAQNPISNPNTDIVTAILLNQQKIIETLMVNQSAPARQKDATVQTVSDTIALLKSLQSMTPTPTQPAYQETDGIGALAPLLSTLFFPKNESKSKLVPPPPDKNEGDTIRQIIGQGPDSTAQFMTRVLANMPDEQRQDAIDSFLELARIDTVDVDDEDAKPTDNND